MTDDSARYYRHTKIIVTLGQLHRSDHCLAKLINQGVDVFRLEMSRGSSAWASETIVRIREAAESVGRQVAVMMDLKGPRIRTGWLDEPLELRAGRQVRLQAGLVAAAVGSSDGLAGSDIASISISYPRLARDVPVGATILIDRGLLRLRVLETASDGLLCEVVSGGVLRSERCVNLPGVRLNLPCVTEKDKADLRAGVAAGIDFVAFSPVHSATDAHVLRSALNELGSTARILAKIGDQTSVRNIDEIVCESDGLIFARGQLGVELDDQELTLVRSRLIRACQADGKTVIVAAPMEVRSNRPSSPSRSEISDVFAAVREQADAVMLSESSSGDDCPVKSIQLLKQIIRNAEPLVNLPLNSRIILQQPTAKMLRSAAVLAQELGQSGIMVFTRNGSQAEVLAALRPRGVPIYAFTDCETTFRRLLLAWGVEPFWMEFADDVEATILAAMDYLRRRDWVSPGSCLVAITNVLAGGDVIDSLQLRQVEQAQELSVL